MKKYCEICEQEQEWTEDATRGEITCNVCGLAEEHQPADNEHDASETVSEDRFRERVDRTQGRTPGTIPTPSTHDARGGRLSPEVQRRFHRWATRERGHQRRREPMFYLLFQRVVELYGTNVAHILAFLIDAITRRLTDEQEATRRCLNTGEMEALNLPKNVISHSDASVRGRGEQDMLTLMAIAVRELGYDFGLLGPINRKAEAERHHLTPVQVGNVKRITLKHYKARCRYGFAMPPWSPTNVEIVRQDMAECHAANMFDELAPLLTEDQLQDLINRFWALMTTIEEPSTDGYTHNTSIDMLCGAVMMAALEQVGLKRGNASAVASGVGHRSVGALSTLLRSLREAALVGLFPAGRALLAHEPGTSSGAAESTRDR